MEYALLILFTKIASTGGFMVAVCLLALGLVLHHNKKSALYLALSAAGLMLAVELLKNLFQMARPMEPLIEVTGYGMPSGHAAGAAFLALAVVFLLRTLPTLWFSSIACVSVVFGVAIGVSRVVYQVHTWEQILAGFALGIAFAVLYIFLVRSKKQ